MKHTKTMKKILLSIAVCSVVAIFSSSCKRCSTCSYTFRPAGTSADSTVDVAQLCGNKDERTAYENEVKADASKVGGTVTCDN